MAAGKTLEVPVTVARKDGFKRAIEIHAEGLPKGVQCEPVTSSGEGATAKTMKLKLTASEKTDSGPFRIVGTAEGDGPPPQTARAKFLFF